MQMKKLFLSLLLAAAASMLIPLSANAAEYEAFVGCDDLAENPIPAHVCQVGDFPGAYFESDVETEYEICVEFPSGEEFCLGEEFAEAGVLYVNSITSEAAGTYFVSWYVEGAEVGSWSFRMDAPPPPPPPTVIPTPAPVVPPVIAPAPSTKCLQAQKRVKKLKDRLQKAGLKQRSNIRAKLKSARAAAKNAC
jgi:hypothetical protein